MWRHVLARSALVAFQSLLLIALSASVGVTRSSQAARAESERLLGLDLYRPDPQSNPSTPEKVQLGRRLFRERLLSRDESLACSDCHQPRRAFTDGRATSVGVYGRVGTRSVPTLINKAWGESFFWDGRIETLEQQVLQPVLARIEMDLTVEEAVERLANRPRYRNEFREVFGSEVNGEDLAFALSSYVRTIQAGNSPFDRYVLGRSGALNDRQTAGLRLFRGKANCTTCHVGPTLTDEEFHNTGVAWNEGEFLDSGRYSVTNREEDRGKFKTPTLREVARTAPYMHDGSLPTLREVIDFYNEGGRRNPNIDEELRPLRLTDTEKGQLEAFLEALSGRIQEGL